MDGEQAKYRNRNLGVRTVPANSIRIHPRNWRLHPDYQSGSLHKVLEAVGFVGTLIARELGDGSLELLDGHLRQDLLGSQAVEVTVTDLTDAEADLILATHDQITSLAGADHGRLKELLSPLLAAGLPLADMGWPAYKLEQVLPSETAWVPAQVPVSPPPTAVTPQEVEGAEQALKARMAADAEAVDVLCPTCKCTFAVRVADLLPQPPG